MFSKNVYIIIDNDEDEGNNNSYFLLNGLINI